MPCAPASSSAVGGATTPSSLPTTSVRLSYGPESSEGAASVTAGASVTSSVGTTTTSVGSAVVSTTTSVGTSVGGGSVGATVGAAIGVGAGYRPSSASGTHRKKSSASNVWVSGVGLVSPAAGLKSADRLTSPGGSGATSE